MSAADSSLKHSRWIYLSPHFDDAVLSCGGLIYSQSRQGLKPEIWTVMAGNPPPGSLSNFAVRNQALWGLPDGNETVAMRRAEDREAASRVGAHLVHFQYPDCIYRRSSDGKSLYNRTIKAAIHPADLELVEHLAEKLASSLHPDDVLVCPLALGGHVDHALVRRAAESLNRSLLYFADVPYVLNRQKSLVEGVVGMESRHFPVSEEGFIAWWSGISAYRSQLDSLYKRKGTLEAALRKYWSRSGGINLWLTGYSIT
jgi:LmbE family N-acetylglucosaminyl deacetylase